MLVKANVSAGPVNFTNGSVDSSSSAFLQNTILDATRCDVLVPEFREAEQTASFQLVSEQLQPCSGCLVSGQSSGWMSVPGLNALSCKEHCKPKKAHLAPSCEH